MFLEGMGGWAQRTKGRAGQGNAFRGEFYEFIFVFPSFLFLL